MKIALHLVLAATIMFPASGHTKEMNIAKMACKEAERDARNDVNVKLWGTVGFFFLIFGIVAADVVVSNPPVCRLVGKSPEYVSNYIKCYRKTIVDIQDRAALKGCMIGACILPFVYLGSVRLISMIMPADENSFNCFFYLLIAALLHSS